MNQPLKIRKVAHHPGRLVVGNVVLLRQIQILKAHARWSKAQLVRCPEKWDQLCSHFWWMMVPGHQQKGTIQSNQTLTSTPCGTSIRMVLMNCDASSFFSNPELAGDISEIRLNLLTMCNLLQEVGLFINGVPKKGFLSQVTILGRQMRYPFLWTTRSWKTKIHNSARMKWMKSRKKPINWSLNLRRSAQDFNGSWDASMGDPVRYHEVSH